VRVHDEQRLEPFFIVAALLLLFATSFTDPLLILALSAAVLVAGSILLPHARRRGLIAAGLALIAALVLVRLAYSLG
jgi:hypothetical protein